MLSRFTVVGPLGSGGQGRVLAVRDAARGGAVVALKETRNVAALAREFGLLARLRHPNLAVVYDWFPVSPLAMMAPAGPTDPPAGPTDPPAAYSQELVAGRDLWRALRGASLAEREATFEQVLRALAYLHALGVAHLDLKPENVLVDRGEDGPLARVVDLGIARLLGEPLDRVSGSRSYIAPELDAEGTFDQRSDLYALGVMMAEIAIGRPPPPELLRGELADGVRRGAWLAREGVPASWLALVTALTARDPGARPASARAAAHLWGHARGRPVALNTPGSVAAMVRAGPPVGRGGPLRRCAQVIAGRGAVVLAGPPGVGRGTVALAAMRSAQVAGHGVEALTQDLSSRALGASLARLLDDASLLERVAAAAVPPPRIDQGQADGERRFAAWLEERARALAEELAARSPGVGPAPVLVVLGLDRAPRPTRLLVRALIRAAEEGARLPLAVLATTDAHEGPAVELLGPLDREATEAFLATRFGAEAADPRVAAALTAATGGIGLHLEALVALLATRGALRLGASGWRWRVDAAELELPADVESTLRGRVAALPERSREVLSAVVWLRFPASATEVAAALGLRDPPRAALLELDAAGLLWRDAGGRFVPAHHGIAAAVGAWSPPGGAARAHAETLERADPPPLARAWHLGGSEGAAEATRIGHRCWEEGRLEAAAAALDLALELDPDEPEALWHRAMIADLLGPRQRQVECLTRLMDLVPEGAARDLEVRAHLFWALTRIGDAARAEAVGREVVALARRRGEGRRLAEVLVHLATILTQRGDYDESEELLAEAEGQALGHDAEALGLQARIANNLGNIHAYREDSEAALARYAEAHRLKVAEGDRVGQRIAMGNMGLMCLRLGRPAEALGHFAKSLAAARITGHRRGEAWSLCAQAELGLEAGAWRWAARRAGAALALAEELGDLLIASDAETTLAEARLAEGEAGAALTHARRGMARAHEAQSGYTAARARLLLAQLALDAEPRAAMTEADALIADPAADEVTRARAAALGCRAATALGDLDAAERLGRLAMAAQGRGRLPAVWAAAADALALAGCDREARAAAEEATRLTWARALAWPEEALALGAGADEADSPSRATVLAASRALGLALEGVGDGRGGDGSTAASKDRRDPVGTTSGREAPRVELEALARGDRAALDRAIGQELARIVTALGAERVFLALPGAGGEVIGCDADGEAIAEAARRLPSAAVEQARAAGGIWVASGEVGRGAVAGVPLLVAASVASGEEATPVLVLQNRFVPAAFDAIHDQGEAFDPLCALVRVRALEDRVAALLEAVARAEDARVAAETRSTEEVLLLRRELESTRERLGPRHDYPDIIFASGKMKRMLREVDRVVATDLPVFIHGESGTGKELVARAVHRLGQRGRGPFVAQNTSAIPLPLFESELFGHERGAFTGAQRAHEGLFRRAHGGTLFLDEIGDLPLEQQVKLLRVLETQEVRPVGSTQTHRVDVRVISATHHDLKVLVREGRFREDLYYRLNVVRIDVPPLRDRPDDIPPLVEHFLAERASAHGQPFALEDGVMKALVRFDWPGNVRQLENEVTRAALLADDGLIRLRDLSPELRGSRPGRVRTGGGLPGGLGRGTLKERVDTLEGAVLVAALAEHEGNKSQVARELGLSRAGLNMKLKRLGLWDSDG